MQTEAFVNTPLNVAIMFTCFFAIIWGIIFKSKLEYEVARWDLNRETQDRIYYSRPSIVLSYVLTSLFTFGFFYCCLLLIALPNTLALGGSIVIIGLTSGFIWFQTGSLLKLLVEGGSRAIDIDFMGNDMISEGDV